MKLAIMQPYLFPYIGYFQLLAAVDKFVFYDDVNFIKNGWINRNRLVISGNVKYFTVPVQGASSFLKINQVRIRHDGQWRRKVLESVRQSYSKAPQFELVYELFSEVLTSPNDSISDLAKLSILAVAGYLELDTEFVMSSSVYGNSELAAADRVIDICRIEGADYYYNLPGGRLIYESDFFDAVGTSLRFIDPDVSEYRQWGSVFHPSLSIVDVLMFNDKTEIVNMLMT